MRATRFKLDIGKMALCLLLMMNTAWVSRALAQDLSQQFKTVKPAVVVINTRKTTALNALGLTGEQGGLGSGVLISDRQILTAAHVVQAADSVKVSFHDGQVIGATVVSSIQQADVALLELEKKPRGIDPVVLGDSDGIKIGEQIFVVGAPYGLSYTLTAGHISNRLSRQELGNGFMAMEFFQTDAAINEGNSGGPMFNMGGEVIGIVSHILTKSGGFEGLGFAATSSATSRILLEGDHIWTGVEAQMIEEPLTTLLNVPQANALVVQRVAAGSLGSRLKLKPGMVPVPIEDIPLLLGGDIILQVMGIKVEDSESLTRMRQRLTALGKRDQVIVVVWRRGHRVELKAKP